jgi:hypothetical protein
MQETLVELRALETEYLQLWTHTKAELALRSITRRSAADQRDLWGAEYVAKVIEMLTDVELLDSAWCFVCEQPCPLSPRSPASQVSYAHGSVTRCVKDLGFAPGMQAPRDH